ncbi:MAG: Neelaredoxin [Chloroflexi bacterium]|jgi:superoxide reductase|nr:Neelaredoxin [Chloroflexota bacterium]
MASLGERLQQADWKKEKHVPVIECPDEVKAGETFRVTLSLGKEIGHPNTTEHHISYVTLYFHPEGDKFTHQVGHYEFSGHGEDAKGPNQGPVYTHHEVVTSLSLNKPGTLHAVALCNIHGLWESAKAVRVV